MKWPKRFRNDPSKAGEIATGVCRISDEVSFWGEHGRVENWVIVRMTALGSDEIHRGKCWYEAVSVARKLALTAADDVGDRLVRIGERVRHARESQGITLRQLAETSGVTTFALGTFERGQKVPTLRTVIAIIDALGITLGSLDDESGAHVVDRCYNVPQVALRLGVSESTIRDVIARGHLQAKRVGRRAIVVRESEIERYLDECATSALYGAGEGRRRRERRQAFRPSGVRGRTDDA